MKTHLMKTILVCSCLLVLTLAAPAAEVKIGLIDLKKVFDDYYKTKLADASIKDEAAGLDKDRKAMTEDYQKAVEDYKKAVEEANNQAISADEREKRKKEAEGRLIKVNDLEQSIKQFDRTARGNLEEKQRLARDRILIEIRTVVNEKAKVAGYTLVFDSAAEALSRTPVVFYTAGADNDLTAAVLAQLNSTAPPDLLRLDEKKETDKKDSKENKK
jgi:outer membrane protein